jgi:hypothetical protein
MVQLPQLTVPVPGDGLGLHLWTLGAERVMEYFRVCTTLVRIYNQRKSNF